ncbi:response regulator [Deminuibacter soli]|nr:response regulator transcription factor [Deminuibacter soli]
MIKIAIADDHNLLRKALVTLINDFENCEVILEASNGKELIELLQHNTAPDVAILDINMPEMNGFMTAEYLTRNHPSINTLALSMMNNEVSVLKMLHAGVKGYLLKDCDPQELKSGVEYAARGEYFINELMNNQLHKNLVQPRNADQSLVLTDREKEFLYWVASDLTYKEIGQKMNVSPRTVDSYRDALFEKLQIKSRVGLAIFAIKNHYVNI